MDNLTNKVLRLTNNKGYFIIRQAAYRGVTYYFGAEITEDGEDFTNNFVFLEKVKEDEIGKVVVKEVKDKEVLDVLAKNIKLD